MLEIRAISRMQIIRLSFKIIITSITPEMSTLFWVLLLVCHLITYPTFSRPEIFQFEDSPIIPYAPQPTPELEAREREGGMKISPEQLSSFQEKKCPADTDSASTLQSLHPTTAGPAQAVLAQGQFEMVRLFIPDGFAESKTLKQQLHANLIRVMDHRYVRLHSGKPIVMPRRYTLPLNQSLAQVRASKLVRVEP